MRLPVAPFALLLFVAGPLVGCADDPPPQAVYVVEAPPMERAEAVPVAPGEGYVWVGGHWHWNGQAYVWLPGAWVVRPRVHAAWVPGRWHRARGGWVWVPGHWR